MLEFKVPLVARDASITEALKTAIDAKTSGVLIATKAGDLRLVHFNDLAAAAAAGRRRVSRVSKYAPVLNVRAKPAKNQMTIIVEAGSKFGFLGAAGKTARLLSISEKFAYPYEGASKGVRCSRPGKPAGKADRDWYHYYPPLVRNPGSPKRCTACNSALP
jgi:hypothetical protein